MNEQPEALRLADLLDEREHDQLDFLPSKAAAELRRLHAVEKQLADYSAALTERCVQDTALIGEMLQAMRLIEHATAPTHEDGGHHEAAHEISSAAIAKAEGKT